MKIDKLLEKLDDVSEQLDMLAGRARSALLKRPDTTLPDASSVSEHYHGQSSLRSTIIDIFDDYTAHSLGSHIGFLSQYCAVIVQYIEFRMKFPNLDSDMLAEIFAPGVSMEIKKKLHETGLSNREVLDLIAAAREEGGFIFDYGDYAMFIGKFTEDYAPGFTEYC